MGILTSNHAYRLIGFLVAIFAALLLSATAAQAQANYFENLDNVGATGSPQTGPQNLISRGWIFRNQSSPLGATSWHEGYLPQGNNIWPSPQAGAGYMAVEGSSADHFGGRVSNWAILPAISGQRSGDTLTFYVYNLESHNTPTLQIRYSPTGGTGTGSGADAVGNFTTILLDITLPTGGWNRYSVTLPGAGRIAFRYYIAQACNFGCASAYTGIDTLSIGAPPPPACNLPPVPSAGQTVTWRASGSPYRVCENISIPPNSTVIVEPGVRVDFDSDKQLGVNGTLNIQGTAAARVVFNAPAVFPPMIDVIDGRVNATFADFGGQFRVETGSTINLSDSRFSGLGSLISRELPAIAPYIQLERCEFTSTLFTMSDALVVLKNNTFTDTYAQLLRGYAILNAPNTFTVQPLRIIREHTVQPFYLDGVNASGVTTTGGMTLAGGNFLLGPTVTLRNNLYTIEVEGGLLPGSNVPTTGNINNLIDVNTGGFGGSGIGRWTNFGIPYRVTELGGSLPGGQLTIDPGVTVEADPGTQMVFRSTRRLIADGLPSAPITFKSSTPGQVWQGLIFQTNATEGPRLEYTEVRDARFGALSSDNLLYVENSIFRNNEVGANANSFGWIIFGKTRFINNTTGASVSELGTLSLMNQKNPNSFEGNTAGIDAFNIGSSSDARQVWWNHPTGPRHPQNPGGQGDSVIGAGANGISIFPFLTASPDFTNTPPVVRLVEPGLSWTTPSPTPDYLVEPGTKYIIRWEAQDTDAIVSQKILFSPDGHYPDRFIVVAELPPDQRSYEWTVPNPGFAVTNQPQFLRVVAIDVAGQEGWDQTPMVVPSGRLTGELNITTDLTGMTFYAGQSIPDLTWTGTMNDSPIIEPFIVLEADGTEIGGVNVSGQGGVFFEKFPNISTDTARLAIRARNNGNDIKWFFAPGYFSIRHDPRLNLVPPTVQLVTPAAGMSYAAGAIVPITWTASDDEALYSFDIQATYDGGRTWHVIKSDLPATARSYDWQLPPTVDIPNLRVRVIARDIRFQNNSSGSGTVFRVGQGSSVGLSLINLNPVSVISGSTSKVTVTLTERAPAGGVTVALSSSNTAVATIPASLTLPAGVVSASVILTTNSSAPSSTVTISASYGGVTKTVDLIVSPQAATDTVSISRADYTASKRELRVQAMSTNRTAVLKVYTADTNDLIGTLSNRGQGRYDGQFLWPENPQNVRVKSSLGGSATKAVSLR